MYLQIKMLQPPSLRPWYCDVVQISNHINSCSFLEEYLQEGLFEELGWNVIPRDHIILVQNIFTDMKRFILLKSLRHRADKNICCMYHRKGIRPRCIFCWCLVHFGFLRNDIAYLIIWLKSRQQYMLYVPQGSVLGVLF